MENVVIYIEKISQLWRDGFTVNVVTLKPITKGFAVAAKETQNSFNRAGLIRVIEFAKNNGCAAIGGWYDSESGLFYYDAVNIYENEKDAIRAGRENEQIAIYDLTNGREIRL